MKSHARGFTLVELLVVIAIVSILAGLLLPALSKAQNAALSSACGSNQKQLALATAAYLADSHGWYPLTASLPFTGQYSDWYPFWGVKLMPYLGIPAFTTGSVDYANRHFFPTAAKSYRTAAHCPARRGNYASDFRAAWYAPVRECIKNGSMNLAGFRDTQIPRPAKRVWINEIHPHGVTSPVSYSYTITATDTEEYARIAYSADDTGGPNDIRPAAIHDRGGNVQFFDGHVKFMLLTEQLFQSRGVAGSNYGTGESCFDIYK